MDSYCVIGKDRISNCLHLLSINFETLQAQKADIVMIQPLIDNFNSQYEDKNMSEDTLIMFPKFLAIDFLLKGDC